MYDSPKAAHFRVLSAHPIDPIVSLDIRWKVANRLRDAGITNMMRLTDDEQQTIDAILHEESQLFDVTIERN